MMRGKRSVLEMGLSVLLVVMIMATTASSFTTLPPFAVMNHVQHSDGASRSITTCSSSALYLASGGGGGFGGGTAADKNKKTKKGPSTASAALKPKQQWDRYGELKREDKIRVAIRIVAEKDDEEGEGDWIDLGRIKSKDNLYTEIAVARQRALIAEVSRERRIGKNRTILRWFFVWSVGCLSWEGGVRCVQMRMLEWRAKKQLARLHFLVDYCY
jgi:hypothetical protein